MLLQSRIDIQDVYTPLLNLYRILLTYMRHSDKPFELGWPMSVVAKVRRKVLVLIENNC